jgi:putative membrane protein
MLTEHLIEVAHIFFVVAWMAGLFYLPRLFVYHAAAIPESETSETFKIMERRLFRGIIMPSAILSVIFGLMLAMVKGTFREGWLHMKLLLVFLLILFTAYLFFRMKDFAADKNKKSPLFFKLLNEVPTLLLLGILLLVVLKPF